MFIKKIFILIITVATPSLAAIKEDASLSSPDKIGNCLLPPYPAHGTYAAPGHSNLQPGDSLPSFHLNISCNPGYGVEENRSIVYCFNGVWSGDFPQCVRLCRLNRHPSVEYRCQISGAGGPEGLRDCAPFEPVGTSVRPTCNQPNYYSAGELQVMKCSETGWNYIATCTPECGRITPAGDSLILDGRYTEKGELPWYAFIYQKTVNPYMQICGGSLVSSTVVISAAQCFWNDVRKKLPPNNFAVAVGKLYRPWNDPRDGDAQKSDVREVIIPVRFQGSAANFQDDIAMVMLDTGFEFKVYVRPVCVDFDINFDRRQLQEGKLGKVAGWVSSAEGVISQTLKVVEMPYMTIENCINNSPSSFRELITSDKICAGFTNGSALCKGSGGGLAFPEYHRGVEQYYLRGILSVAPRNDNNCNANTIAGFTQILKHEHFIKEYLN